MIDLLGCTGLNRRSTRLPISNHADGLVREWMLRSQPV
jgi:hypothetical protein